MFTQPTTLRFLLHKTDGQIQEISKSWRTTFVIGRRSQSGPQVNDIFLDDAQASCRHCRLFLSHDEGIWMVEDMGSIHGTRLQGKPVLQPTPLPYHVWLRVGATHILFLDVSGENMGEIPPLPEIFWPSSLGSLDEAATVLVEKSPSSASMEETCRAAISGVPTMCSEHASESITLLPEVKNHDKPLSIKEIFGDFGQHVLSYPLFQLFLEREYLDLLSVRKLLEQTQLGHTTFFYALATSRSLRFVDAMFQLTADHLEMELISDELSLANQAISTNWLSFNRAETMGLVMLKPLSSAQNRYATLDPFDLTARDWVVQCGGKPATPILVYPDIFFSTLRHLKNRTDGETKEIGLSIDITLEEELQILEQVGEVDIPQMVNYLLHRAHLQMASDIHIEPTEESLLIRMRVDGLLHEEMTLPRAFHPEVVSRLKIMARLDVAEKRRPQDGRIGVMIRNHSIDIRVSSYPTVFGEKFVLRLLDRHALRPTIESLKMNDRDFTLLKEKLNAPNGLILISGPTGSGKTTTLYSCLSAIDKDRKNVLTVEDPVEYRLKGVHQMQVNSKIGLDFASGLRTILRQDPDIIMVGEIRDKETAGMAVQAALTGHLVFSTIHAKDTIGVITRLLELGVEPYLLASAISLSIAQRLIRLNCHNCKVPINGALVLRSLKVNEGIGEDRLQALGIQIDPNLDYIQGSGCPSCRNTGYKGRQPVFEIFEINEAARELILDKKQFNSNRLREIAAENGMTSLMAHGEHLVLDELTTFSELIRVMGEKG
ncbi:MAG: Flp pilus assembly complex ATPase component TadA [Magnetococcus sp. DMHC-6]